MLIIVQARFSSTRLPGKVLRPLAGRPMLGWLVERLKLVKRSAGVIVATSTEKSDDAIARFCMDTGVSCFRNSLMDVTERLAAAAEWAEAETFVRISGDSPLMSPILVDEIITLYQAHDVDIATNAQVRTFPKGLSVEAIRVDALRRAQKLMQPGEAEHVTQAFYRRPKDFRIINLASGHEWGAIQMSVDTADDFMQSEKMLATMGSPRAALSVGELVALNEHCVTKAIP